MIYHINPVAKPRMTQRDKWLSPPRRAVQKYRTFCDLVQLNKVELPTAGAKTTFHLPVPQGWAAAKKLRMIGRPHQQRPDLDNLLKALGDAVYRDDSLIWDVSAQKLWSQTGAIQINHNEAPNHERDR